MPANRLSLEITDRYRQHLQTLRQQGVRVARHNWTRLDPENLDRSHGAWVAVTAPALVELQRTGVHLSHAYLAAFASSETGEPPRATPVDEAGVGFARDGKPIPDALQTSLFTVKAAIGEGIGVGEALQQGLARAVRTTSEEVAAPARDSLAQAIKDDSRIVGWRRVTSGGCGACLAAADGDVHPDYELIDTHPFCECSEEPVFEGVEDAFSRPTGEDMFNSWDQAKQDEALGPEAAQLIRDGHAPFRDLIHRDPMAAVPDGITQAPIEALKQDH